MAEDAPREPVGRALDADADSDTEDGPAGWRFGLAAAQTMAARVEALYRDLPSGATATNDDDLRKLRVELERAADVSLDLFDRVLALVRRIDTDGTGSRGAESGDVLVVRTRAGERAAEGFWVHNVSDAEAAPPELRCGEVANFDGVILPTGSLRIECAAAPIAGGNSRFVELVVDLPATTPRGDFHGLVVARDPRLTLRVRVEVT